MRNKIFKNKGGGGLGSLKYLLDKKRVANGTAKVLRGNPEHTEALIKSMRSKQKVMMGVLSFEETYLDAALKEQLMSEYEELTFPGLDPSQYNILWVEHTDKNGKIELNYLIVKLELTSARYLQPHYYKADYPRVDAWERLQNLKHGFSDPLDPRKARTLQGVHPDSKIMKDYMSLDIFLHRLVAEGELKSRDEIISFIEKNSGVVTRRGKDNLSVKLKGQKKAQRFKTGTTGIYSRAFTSREALVGIQLDLEKAIQSYTEGREDFKKTEIPRLKARIEKMKEYKKKELLKEYPHPELPKYQEEIIIKEEEIINHDRDRETAAISQAEERIIRERVEVRAAAKRERSQRVHNAIEDARERSFDYLAKAAETTLEVRRRDAERLEKDTRSLVKQFQGIGNKVREWFKKGVTQLTEVQKEAYRLFELGNPHMEPEIDGEKGPKIRGPGG